MEPVAPCRVLFLCPGNPARAQMAEALLRLDGGGGIEVRSAGLSRRAAHPLTICALNALGIDTAPLAAKPLDRELGEEWDFIITIGEAPPGNHRRIPQGRVRLQWAIPDPASAEGSEAERYACFSAVRDAIRGRVRTFLRDGIGSPLPS